MQLGTIMLTSEIEFQVMDDDIIEADEEFTIMISEITFEGRVFNNMSSVTVQIIDDDDGKLFCKLKIYNNYHLKTVMILHINRLRVIHSIQ